MKALKELSSYIIGLLFIILGLLTFSYIEYVNQRSGIGETTLYYIIGAGFVFIIIGTVFMAFFVKSDKKKKSSK